MRSNRSPVSAIILLLCCLSPVTATADQDDLVGLYTLAKAKNPALGRAVAGQEISRADEERAFSYLLPRADASAGINWISNVTINYDPKGDRHGSYTGHSYGLGARVPLLNLAAVYNLSASRAAIRSADAALGVARQDLITRLAEAYFGILKAKADERLYRDELKRLGQIHEQSQAFLKAGTGDIIAVYEAKARMDGAAADLVRAESQRRIAEQQLAGIVGREAPDVRDLGTFTPQGPVPADLGWWLETMEKHQPYLVEARENLQQRAETLKSTRAGHLPTLQLSGGYSVSKGSTFLPEVETRQWYGGFNLSVPIYSGGETAARTRRAVAEEADQRFVLEEVREQRIQKLKEAYLNLQYNAALVASVAQKKASAEVQLAAVRKGRGIGTRTAVDLLNAEQTFAVAQRDLNSALYDNALRRLQLRSAAGILTEDDLRELNEKLRGDSPPGTPPS